MMWVLVAVLLVGAVLWTMRESAPAEAFPVDATMTPLPGGHSEWDGVIRDAATNAGLPAETGPLMLKAIIEHESAHTWEPEILGDPSALCSGVYAVHPDGIRNGRRTSTAGFCSLGLMQINRYWNSIYADTYDLLDGPQNIAAGADLVAGLWNSFQDWDRVLAAYNGGPDAGRSWPSVSAGVRGYVLTVGGTFRRYAGEAGVTA